MHVYYWIFPYKRFEYFRASIIEILQKTLFVVEIKWLHHKKAIAKYEPTETFLKLLLDPHFASIELICIPIAPWVYSNYSRACLVRNNLMSFFNQLLFGVTIKVSFIVFSSPLCNLQGPKDLVNVVNCYIFTKKWFLKHSEKSASELDHETVCF